MLETMYEVPADSDVKEVIVSENVINNEEEPLRVYGNSSQTSNT